MTANSPIKMPRAGDRLVERYTVMRRVSLGGFGAVYKAVQDTLGREVAIKILLPEIFSNQDYVEQFRQEALLTSQLRHPNTITVYDYGETDAGLLFLVMEWLDGITLSQALREQGALSYERCYHISYQMLKSLAEAHDRGMVHRDLKPSNIMVCEQYGEKDFVKVLDFGLVKNLSNELLVPRGASPIEAPKFTEKRRAPGTPHYMAPEQATGKGTTTAADLYSFGLILYEMLTGQRAFDGTDKMRVLLKQAREPVPALPQDLQETFLGKIVARCSEKSPTNRPQKAGELVRDYQRVEDTGGVEVHTAEIRTTDSWRAMAEPRSIGSEFSSVPEDEFIGRGAEQQEFAELLARVEEGGGGTTLLMSGELGAGKTALVHAFVERFLDQTGGQVLQGGYQPGRLGAYDGIKRALRTLLNLRVHEASDVRHQIRQGLDALEIDDFYLLNFLRNFLFGGFGEREDQRDECRQRLEGFLTTLAAEGPVLFVLENLQWADPLSLEMVWRLASGEVMASQPIVLVVTWRSEQSGGGSHELQLVVERLGKLDHRRLRELRLGPLGKRDCLRLIERAIDMQRGMARRCLKLSRGNPLWLGLVVRYLIDEAEHIGRQLEQQAGVDPQEARLYLPNTLDKIALRRVDQVVRKYGQETFRDVLCRAALVGESFDVGVLERVLRRERQYELLDRMAWSLELWRREELLRRPWEGGETMEFIHPHLVEHYFNEAAPRLHLTVAQVKEDVVGEGGQVLVERAELARHFRAGEAPQLAIQYLETAARQAFEQSHLTRARTLYQELLGLLSPDDPEHLALCKQAYLALGDVSRRLHEVGPSNDYFAQARALARRDADRSTEGLARCGFAELALDQGQLEDANRHFHHARGLLSEADTHAFGRVLLGIGRVSELRGDWTPSRSCFEHAYRLGNQYQDYALMAHALQRLGGVDIAMGDNARAHERFSQALKLYQAVERADDEAGALLALTRTCLAYRQLEESRRCVDAVMSIKQRLGDQVGFARALLAAAELALDALALDEAQKLVLRALPIFKQQADRRGVATGQTLLAEANLIQGQTEPARRLCGQALQFFEESGDLWFQVLLKNRLAWLELLNQRAERASERLDATMMLLDVHGSEAHRAETLNHLGLLAELQGDAARASERYNAAYEVGQRHIQPPPQFLARLALFRLGIFQQPGRWYHDELWEMARSAEGYGMREVQLRVLASLAWFEGASEEGAEGRARAIAALLEVMRELDAPLALLLSPLAIELEAARKLLPDEQATAYLRSGALLREELRQALGAEPPAEVS